MYASRRQTCPPLQRLFATIDSQSADRLYSESHAIMQRILANGPIENNTYYIIIKETIFDNITWGTTRPRVA